jgi:hypothetical protein
MITITVHIHSIVIRKASQAGRLHSPNPLLIRKDLLPLLGAGKRTTGIGFFSGLLQDDFNSFQILKIRAHKVLIVIF